jgi:hypothetical protein
MANARMHDHGSAEEPAAASDVPAVTVSLEIKNHYADGTHITTVNGVTVEEPWDLDDEDELADWAMHELFEFTGTGRTEGDATYDITITASNDHRLIGKRFEIG